MKPSMRYNESFILDLARRYNIPVITPYKKKFINALNNLVLKKYKAKCKIEKFYFEKLDYSSNTIMAEIFEYEITFKNEEECLAFVLAHGEGIEVTKIRLDESKNESKI